jgi:peptidoglycan hydrolase-like protein with peptidoglycan-binding domain
MTERVLPFDRAVISQNTGFWCGPATVQNILSSRMKVDEAVIAREMGTDADGTDYVGLLADALNRRLPDAHYKSVYLDKHDPPTVDEKNLLWWNLVRSIDNGYGVATNWVSPPGNKPRGVKGSPTPRYSGGTTFHYVGALGWSDEGNNGRPSVFIVDSGFWPGAYWIDFDQYASLIVPKGYAYADLPLLWAPPPGVVLPPGVTVREGIPPVSSPPPPPVVVPPKPTGARLVDPATDRMLTRLNKNANRGGMPRPLWLVGHTSESRSTAVELRNYCETNLVSYNRVGDDRQIVVHVDDTDGPWAARNANNYALHYCFSSSFASWSRGQWLDATPADGYNEREALRLGAKQFAWWIQDSIDRGREIPAIYIGGKAQPPWGANGILAHVDLGQWGGGHTDWGVNFPVDVFMSDIHEWLTGSPQPPVVPLPPVVLPGTNPDQYADWLEYRGKPNPNIEHVKAIQTRLKRAYASYAGHLLVDGVFGFDTYDAVREFQRRSHLVADGIVGPMTAAALRP